MGTFGRSHVRREAVPEVVQIEARGSRRESGGERCPNDLRGDRSEECSREEEENREEEPSRSAHVWRGNARHSITGMGGNGTAAEM